MQIYLARNNQQAGPYTLEQVNAMLANHQVVLTDLAWHEGMDNWLPLGQLTGGKLVYLPTATVADPSSPFAPHNDLPIESLAASAAYSDQSYGGTTTTLASSGTRILAALIDMFITVLLIMIVLLTTLPQATFAQVNALMAQSVMPSPDIQQKIIALIPDATRYAMLLAFFALTLVQFVLIAKRGQSIGKILFQIRIVDQQTVMRARPTQSVLIRTMLFNLLYNLPLIGTLVFVVDFIFLFTEHHRTLHDRLAKTVVVQANPAQLPASNKS